MRSTGGGTPDPCLSATPTKARGHHLHHLETHLQHRRTPERPRLQVTALSTACGQGPWLAVLLTAQLEMVGERPQKLEFEASQSMQMVTVTSEQARKTEAGPKGDQDRENERCRKSTRADVQASSAGPRPESHHHRTGRRARVRRFGEGPLAPARGNGRSESLSRQLQSDRAGEHTHVVARHGEIDDVPLLGRHGES